LRDRVALITGGSRGIGAAIADVFRQEGAVVLTPTRAELDVSDPASVTAYVDGLPGDVDILVNDAGVNELATLGDLSDAVLTSTLNTNLVGPVLLARALVPGMAERRWGRVVNISSIWGVVSKAGRLPYIV
jgi:3-oxoacyl-[acyl-carrier protein] reductase